MLLAPRRTSSSTPISTGSLSTVDGTSGLPGTVPGRSLNLCMFRPLFYKSPSATTLCPLRTGEDGVVMGRRSGSHTTDVSGAKKPASVTGVNARSAGVGARGKAARQDSPSKDVANTGPAITTPGACQKESHESDDRDVENRVESTSQSRNSSWSSTSRRQSPRSDDPPVPPDPGGPGNPVTCSCAVSVLCQNYRVGRGTIGQMIETPGSEMPGFRPIRANSAQGAGLLVVSPSLPPGSRPRP